MNEEVIGFQEKMWEYWGGTKEHAPPCLLCWRPAVCLHEIEPRSTYRDWYKTFPNVNSIAVCADCHRAIHSHIFFDRGRMRNSAERRAKELHNETT